MKARIFEDVTTDNLRQLATVTILQAFTDAKSKDVVTQLDAVMWLTGPDFAQWAEWAGMSFVEVWQVLTSGQARKARTRRSGGRGHSETI